MNDELCRKFGVLKAYLPDELGETGTLTFGENKNFIKYCPENGSGGNECNNDLDRITAGFLWSLEQCYSGLVNKDHNANSNNAFFLYMISWISYKLNQIKEKGFTTINEFFTKNVKNSGKYKQFISDAYKIGELKKFMDERDYLMNINIEDLSKCYDSFKLLCNMYDDVETNKPGDTLSNNVTMFVNKYTELKDDYNIGDTTRSKILPVLSTDYDNFKNYCTRKGANCKYSSSFPEISEFSAQIYGVTSSSSSTGKKLFTVLSIFGAIAFFLGISYKVNNKKLKNYFHYIYATH
ncbi:putative yir2 protein [Plasmodium yoelii yoelii]|uniref:Yir2 protein n=1 Tax=Plasmodium yoelii yoelii TaxID=73239 RepID=Q7RB69_PLAYO|nr:putative yir2 protein [Plasmodium yoelii yoelii]